MKRTLSVIVVFIMTVFLLSAPVMSASTSVRLRGDVDGNGLIDGCDANLVSAVIEGRLNAASLGTAAYEAADCNYDGVVNGQDLALLQQAGMLAVEIEQRDEGWLPGTDD